MNARIRVAVSVVWVAAAAFAWASPKDDSKKAEPPEQPKTAEPKTEPKAEPKTEPKAEPKPEPKTEPAKPEPPAEHPAMAAVRLLEAALKSGDPAKVSEAFAPPLSAAVAEQVAAADKAAEAAKSLEAAVEAKFGRSAAKTEPFPLIDLAAQVRSAFGRTASVTAEIDKQQPEADSVRMTVRFVERAAEGPATRTRTELWTAVKTAGGWRMLPRETDKELRAMSDRTGVLKRLPEEIAATAKLLAAGRYKDRDEVIAAVQRAIRDLVRE